MRPAYLQYISVHQFCLLNYVRSWSATDGTIAFCFIFLCLSQNQAIIVHQVIPSFTYYLSISNTPNQARDVFLVKSMVFILRQCRVFCTLLCLNIGLLLSNHAICSVDLCKTSISGMISWDTTCNASTHLDETHN